MELSENIRRSILFLALILIQISIYTLLWGIFIEIYYLYRGIIKVSISTGIGVHYAYYTFIVTTFLQYICIYFKGEKLGKLVITVFIALILVMLFYHLKLYIIILPISLVAILLTSLIKNKSIKQLDKKGWDAKKASTKVQRAKDIENQIKKEAFRTKW